MRCKETHRSGSEPKFIFDDAAVVQALCPVYTLHLFLRKTEPLRQGLPEDHSLFFEIHLADGASGLSFCRHSSAMDHGDAEIPSRRNLAPSECRHIFALSCLP